MIGVGGEISTFWGTIGAGIAMAITSAVTWYVTRHRRNAEAEGHITERVGHQTVSAMLAAQNERLEVLERRVTEQDSRIQKELELRLKAQEEASRLRIRVDQLEAVLRGMGATVPPPWHKAVEEE